MLKIFGFKAYRTENYENSDTKKENSNEDKKTKSLDADDVKKFIKTWKNEKVKAKKNIKKVLKNLSKFANLKGAELDLRYGAGDAAQTGIVSGILYGFVYGIFSGIYYIFNIKKKNMKISMNPDFNAESLEIYMRFEFRARIIFAVLSVFWIIKLYFLLKKEVN